MRLKKTHKHKSHYNKRKTKNNKKKTNKRKIIRRKTIRRKTNRRKRKSINKKKYGKRYNLKGGMTGYTKTGIPYLPPGGPYDTNSSLNGLGKGYYYENSKDLHAPNDYYQSSNNSLMKGGGLIPQDIINMGRNVVFGAKQMYSGLRGFQLPASANPDPTYQPELSKNIQLDSQVPNVNNIVKNSKMTVNKL